MHLCYNKIVKFQSAPPRGERPCSVTKTYLQGPFQSTLPRGERPGFRSRVLHQPADFNPRSRVGSDCCCPESGSQSCISIHAPAWGATIPKRHSDGQAYISIHAPAWGATVVALNPDPKVAFQSTLPRGERLGTDGGGKRLMEISIHVPAWGATNGGAPR